jgi:uncharacterized repeat protein (TIGR03803 family)
MNPRLLFVFSRWLMIVTAVLLISNTAAAQWREKPLHRFTGINGDGIDPLAGLVADAAGNLYGTTVEGGETATCKSCGILFELSPPSSSGGEWIETVLHTFSGSPNDGEAPLGNLIFDSLGNLYGTTASGGASNSGTVFELSPPATQGAPWTETILYSFMGHPDGQGPDSGLTVDAIGNLYGVTSVGGKHTEGTVFELSPPGQSGGSWTETILYSFGKTRGEDGASPTGGVVFDKAGHLYGVTVSNGAYTKCNCGTVFELSQSQDGSWLESTLHSFGAAGDGKFPAGGLVFSDGALYGVTERGGNTGCSLDGCGTVYEITASGTYTLIHRFVEDTSDGILPQAGLVADDQGNLYGTTDAGGGSPYCLGSGGQVGCGTVYELSRPSQPGGTWAESILYAFSGFNGDGSFPQAPVLFGKGAVKYGTTTQGGDANCSYSGSVGCGTVFEVGP